MKAIICTKYGLRNLVLRNTEKPIPNENEVLIEVYASSVTTHNLVMITGKPFFVRLMAGGISKPKVKIPGSDLAGRIIAKGKNVSQFNPGDEVFGEIFPHLGAYAEYIATSENTIVLKPANISFEEAAGVPQSALVALQGLRDKGQIKAGQKVLIYGASGGIGTLAVQIAKYYETEVTGVCSTKNIELVRSIGADNVIDYTKEDYSKIKEQFDLIFAIAYRSLKKHLRLLAPGGIYVSTGGPSLKRIYQDMIIGPNLAKKKGKRIAGGWTIIPNRDDLHFIKDLIESGHIKPVIDRTYSLHEVAVAFRYYEQGHARGKVIITIKSE